MVIKVLGGRVRVDEPQPRVIKVGGIGPQGPAGQNGEVTYTYLAQLKQWVKNPETIIQSTITRDSNQAVTSASVVWPDGRPGTFTGTPSTQFAGAVDSYTITYVPASGPTLTFTQPAVTRNSSGAVTNVPAITVT